jgi:hypothetical protein
MAADRVRVLAADNNSWIEVTLHEGKHHEVRRLLEAVGHPVSKLRRVAFGPVSLKGLAPGQYRALTAEEVRALRHGRRAEPRPPRLARAARHARSRPESPRPPAGPRAERTSERPSPRPHAPGPARPPRRRGPSSGSSRGHARRGPRG